MSLQVGAELRWNEPDSGSDANGRQLTAAEQQIDLSSRDRQVLGGIGDRHQRLRLARRRIYGLHMGAHPARVAQSKGSRRSAERSVVSAARLWTELCYRKAPAGEKALILDALLACEAAVNQRLRGQSADLTQSQLDNAARTVLAYVQAGFRYLEAVNAPQHRGTREVLTKLWRAQDVVAKAMGAPLKAKRSQIEAGRGRPLTVCIGRFARRLPSKLEDEIEAGRRLNDHHRKINPQHQDEDYQVLRWDFFTYGDGCGQIIEDSISEARPSFAAYCTRCRKRTSARQEARLTQIRGAWNEADPVFPQTVFESEGPAVVFLKRCRACGELFRTTIAQQRVCRRGCRPAK
jgi:hypothetical protein